jgi:hypothetical protein
MHILDAQSGALDSGDPSDATEPHDGDLATVKLDYFILSKDADISSCTKANGSRIDGLSLHIHEKLLSLG